MIYKIAGSLRRSFSPQEGDKIDNETSQCSKLEAVSGRNCVQENRADQSAWLITSHVSFLPILSLKKNTPSLN